MENFEITFEEPAIALAIIDASQEFGLEVQIESEDEEYTVSFSVEDENDVLSVIEAFENVAEDLDEDFNDILDEFEEMMTEANMYHRKDGKFADSPPLSGKREVVKSVNNKRYKIKTWKAGRPKKQTSRKMCGRDARSHGLNIRCWDNKNMG